MSTRKPSPRLDSNTFGDVSLANLTTAVESFLCVMDVIEMNWKRGGGGFFLGL